MAWIPGETTLVSRSRKAQGRLLFTFENPAFIDFTDIRPDHSIIKHNTYVHTQALSVTQVTLSLLTSLASLISVSWLDIIK